MPYITRIVTLGDRSIETSIGFDTEEGMLEYIHAHGIEEDEEEKETSVTDLILMEIAEFINHFDRQPETIYLTPATRLRFWSEKNGSNIKPGDHILGLQVLDDGLSPDIYLD